MKRIFFTAAALFGLIHSFAQSVSDTGFKSRKLKLEEINFVSSYYRQDGFNAAVTGGQGSEKLTDLANVIDVKLVRYDSKMRKHNFTIEAGIDHYSSASSDMVDLKANSSASSADNRIYPSIDWTREDETRGNSIGAGVSYSSEYDYQSFGANLHLSKKTRNKSGEFTARLQAYFDQVSLIAPIELRGSGIPGVDDAGSSARNTFAGSFSYSQIINEKFQIALLADIVQQQGYLSLPFHRVYFNDGSVHQEHLPDQRMKFPLAIRANYFFGDKIILRSYYRFYTDDWGLNSHTANIEIPVKITPFFSISPFYRYYDQSAIDYFKPYAQHTATEEFYTSNFDLSDFQSHFYGSGMRVAPPKGVFGIQKLSALELRYGHYTKSTKMKADIVSLNLKFSF